eukprot:CAMPEP_0182563284 /NCGR_PEP_ID=MMETSP1324-20130603/5459_1 /TAXON_ID=236786 /ORGANISM="Florenciella sp., Strain RCC1587" /LENGTH=56 /DNA_ID=CAMNT_0024776439 /DNA_START=13 /DNA_END=183 /DNA_ORIENTATION=-
MARYWSSVGHYGEGEGEGKGEGEGEVRARLMNSEDHPQNSKPNPTSSPLLTPLYHS